MEGNGGEWYGKEMAISCEGCLARSIVCSRGRDLL